MIMMNSTGFSPQARLLLKLFVFSIPLRKVGQTSSRKFGQTSLHVLGDSQL
jgi:hypothetical protein